MELNTTTDHADISIQENIYTSNTITIEKYVYEKHNIVKIDTVEYYVLLERCFTVSQLEIVLPYIHEEKFKSIIIDLLFSSRNDEIKLAINLIKAKKNN
jgi:hypothetical protein